MVCDGNMSKSRDIEKIPSGIKGFDDLMSGGFPKGGLILVAGGAGAGKTALSTQFLYNGASKYGDKGVYAPFSESRETFNRYAASLGFDFGPLEKEGKITVVDNLITSIKEGVEPTLKRIINSVSKLGAERLVIDSLATMTMGMDETVEVRTIIHLLRKSLREVGCTTLLITETPHGQKRLGTGVEEFIADGIVVLEQFLKGDELKRQLYILKMRGVGHSMKAVRFTVGRGGITVLPPIEK
jgi:KaiC/GvpD/RAD55 family RecA-like ATPase